MGEFEPGLTYIEDPLLNSNPINVERYFGEMDYKDVPIF